jgi:dTDP-4-dehydrorhamnose reductase
MRILLIGANGQLGTDLRHVLAGEVTGIDWPDLDVRDEKQVRSIVLQYRPDMVINCAAQTNVDACEEDPETAFAVNALGAMHVARAAAGVAAAVTYISTDYVFGAAGPDHPPYTETDCPGPVNAYGASKLAGEHLTRAYNPAALVVRTCGLYGHAGARGKGGNFVETMLRLAETGKPIRVVDDQRLSPTWTGECAARIAALVAGSATDIYHVAAPDDCTWFEFARAVFELAELNVDLNPIASSEYPRPARRPSMSAVRSDQLERVNVPPCRPWRAMLRDYLALREAGRMGPLTRSADCDAAEGESAQSTLGATRR